MRCQGTLAAAMVMTLVVTSIGVSEVAAYSTAQCQELSSCGVGGTSVYAFSGVCVCCPEPPTGSILPVQCVPSTPHCPGLSNCKACDLTAEKCDACVSGYVLEPVTRTCTECLVSACDICQLDSEGRRCQLCSEGSYWSTGGECHSVSSSDGSGNEMQCRVAFCRTCSSSTASICTKCDDGYITDSDGLCVSDCRVQNCDMCYTGDSAECQLCAADNQWSSKGCSAATGGCRVGHCTTCAVGDSSTCAACESDYTLTAGYCMPSRSCTDVNCASCPSDTSTCTECKDGYGLVDGACVECQEEHCVHCDDDAKKCTKCAPSYYLTPLLTCSPVPCNIEHCAKCDPQKPSRCQECAAPYVVDSYDGLCRLSDVCAVPNCKTCKPDTSRLCAECDAGYTLSADATSCNDPTTQPCNVEHCSTCVEGDSTRCAYCDSGYYVSNGKCEAVQACYVSNCAQCMLSDSTRCSTCINGYLLTSSYRCVSQTIVNDVAAPYPLWMAVTVLLTSVLAYLA
ncbi:hypothetical protein LSCM1_07407 [Leishmania martiniquensis]|uniref:EGF-like domain-containing protein n=1 Tax=Leishmania martiniquensis TaxID=1580590 RepID=A0A836I3T0_9TRYP|nr:hypothetical protein LSCM1_07407 [Leishmania martiniquensis]